MRMESTMLNLRSIIAAALVVWGSASAVAAQEVGRPLSLEQAVGQALHRQTDVRIARSRARVAEQDLRIATSTLYPTAGLEMGWLRSADPVAVFGTKLRQNRFTEGDFDLPTLNDPAAITDWAGGVRVSWDGLNPAVWAGRDAAKSSVSAARWSEVRTREATVFRTRILYYRAVQAEAQVDAAEAAEEAARATRERFRRRMEEGLLTRADLLQSEAELAAAEAMRMRVEQLRREARLELGLHLGWSADSVPRVSLKLSPPPPDPGAAESVGPSSVGGVPGARRADLLALEANVDAAGAMARSQSLGWVPSLEAFGGYLKHGDAPFSATGTEWSVGLALRWQFFDGFRRPAGVSRANAQLAASRALYEHAQLAARVEVRKALDGVRSARLAVDASAAAARASVEGRDLTRRRFEQGLASPADLLQAEARATAMAAQSIDSLTEYHLAIARLDFALGGRGSTGDVSAAGGLE